MEMSCCMVDILTVLDTDQVGHLCWEQYAAVPASNRPALPFLGDERIVFSRCQILQAEVGIILQPRYTPRLVQPVAKRASAHEERRSASEHMICRLEEVRAQTLGLEWTRAGDFGARGCTGDAGTVGPLQDVAAAAISASRKGHSLFRRYPPEGQSALLPRFDTLLFQKFAASELRNHLRIEGGQLRRKRLLKHLPPRLDPV